jgi:hypothetical protein
LRTLYDDRGARAVLGDLSRVQDALRGTESSASGAGQALSALLAGGVGGAVGAGLVAALGSVQSVLGSIAGLAEGFVRSAIQASMQMEQMRFGLATVLGAWNEVRDAQGRVLTGAERYNALLSLSGELMRSIRAEANRTILETAELTELVQSGLGYAYAKGLSADQAVRVISAIGQAGKLMGLSGPMLVQEVRALLGGGRLESSQVALAFGITREMLERSGQDLAEALLRALSSVTDAASVAADRLDVQWSTLTSQVQEALAQVGDGLTGGLAQFLQQLNEVLGQLLESGVFERLGIFLRLLWQALVEGVGSLVEGVRGVWSWVSGVVSSLVGSVRGWMERSGLGALWEALPAGAREMLGQVGLALTPPALRSGVGLWGAFGGALEGYRVAWDVAGMMVGRGGGGGGNVRVAPRRASVGGGGGSDASRRRQQQRLAREGAQAAQIERKLRAGAYEEAWSGLVEVLTPETAELLAPVLEAIEVELAGLRAAEVLSQIGQETSGRLRKALSAQAWEEYRRVLSGYASRRGSVLARGVAERERELESAREREARLRERRRQLLRGLYGAVGEEESVLRMEYEDAVRAWLEAGVSPLWAGIYGAVQVYAPVERRREELRRRDTEAFVGQLREFGERARAEELRGLTRRYRGGLISTEDYARALRRLAGAGRLDEGGLETLAAGVRGSVEAGLPEARLFEDAESFRARWLAALGEMRAYWGQFLEGLLRPEEYGRVMEVFDALAVEFERRFVRVASGRWSEFVEGLVGALASGVRGAFVGLLESVMADFRRLGEGLRGFFEGLVGMIRRAIAQLVYERVIRAWVERLLDWLQQRLGGLGVGDGSGVGGGGGKVNVGNVLTSIAIGAFVSWAGGALGKWLGGIFKFQTGGALVPRRVALVGEQGPELLVMGAGAYGGVYPASLLEQVRFGAGAPSAVQITVQVSDFSEVGLARRVATEVRRVLRERGV